MKKLIPFLLLILCGCGSFPKAIEAMAADPAAVSIDTKTSVPGFFERTTRVTRVGGTNAVSIKPDSAERK